MSDLNHKFLTQLKTDFAAIASDLGEPGQRLSHLLMTLDFDPGVHELPLFFDKQSQRVLIAESHPSIQRLLNDPQRRRSDLLFLASSMVSILNREMNEISDIDERSFHTRLLRFALEESQGSWAGAI